mgnify:CR=1 FL=1
MDDILKIVLKKLKTIENKLDQLEKKIEKKESMDLNEQMSEKKKYDPLFNRAWEIILNENSDVSASFLAKQLNIDVERAEAIMDQLEESGFGVCYTKKV